MVSDSDLIARLQEILANSDLSTTTTSFVRRKLEEEFSIDLSDRKTFVREQVDLVLQSQFETAEEQHDQTAEELECSDSKEVEDEDGDEIEERLPEKRKVKGRKKKRVVKNNGEVKKRGGFNILCSLSPQLQELVGVPELSRGEVVKQVWAYIREKQLQDPNNRRNIMCDESMRPIFRVDCIDMFQMNKVLSKHIWPLESNDAVSVKSSTKGKETEQDGEVVPVKSSPKGKERKQDREGSDSDEPKSKKRQKGANSGIHSPLQLSDALVKFLDTGETALPRSGVVKRIWDYIKLNNLQDPSDKRRILCDDRLKELFGVDTFIGFGVSKHLVPHFIKS